MELRQLGYFVAVVEEANFTRAAERMHVAQPAISAQIRLLEREFGEQLLDRSRRTVTLTTAGEAVLPYAKAALRAVNDARLAVEELTQLIRGGVSMGTVNTDAYDIASLLAAFHTTHPQVDIALVTKNSYDLVEDIRNGDLDLAIVSLGPDEHPDGLAFTVLDDERIDAGVGASHELARRSTITPAELATLPLIALPVGTSIRRQLDNACKAAGVAPKIAFEGNIIAALARLAQQGLGVAVLPQSSLAQAELHRLRITPALRYRTVLAWRSTSPVSPAGRALLAQARQLLT
jgi:DNA-binding transcriptional LysR family regulator